MGSSKEKRPYRSRKQSTFRNEKGEMILAEHRFRPGEEAPVPAGEERKGDVRALLKGLSMGIVDRNTITSQSLIDFEVAYLNYIYESDIYIIPDIIGFCSFCGMTKVQLDRIGETKMKPEPVVDPMGETVYVSPCEVIQKIKNDFIAIKSQLGLAGKIPPVVYIANMNNADGRGLGWTSKSELVLTPQNPIQTSSGEELDKIIADFESE